MEGSAESQPAIAFIWNPQSVLRTLTIAVASSTLTLSKKRKVATTCA